MSQECKGRITSVLPAQPKLLHSTVDPKNATMVKAKTKKHSTKKEMMFLTPVV